MEAKSPTKICSENAKNNFNSSNFHSVSRLECGAQCAPGLRGIGRLDKPVFAFKEACSCGTCNVQNKRNEKCFVCHLTKFDKEVTENMGSSHNEQLIRID